jgi:hypothetical protein
MPTSVISLNSSPATCDGAPLPPDPILILPGRVWWEISMPKPRVIEISRAATLLESTKGESFLL